MEYLREEAIEKEEEGETATSRIETIEVEESQPVEVWSEQKRKVSWIDWIKTIGRLNCIYIFTNIHVYVDVIHLTKFCFQKQKCCPVPFSSLRWFMVQLRQRFTSIEISFHVYQVYSMLYVFFVIN